MTMTSLMIKHFSQNCCFLRKSILTVASNHHVLISLEKRNIRYASCGPKRPDGFLTTKPLVWEFSRSFYLDENKEYKLPIHRSLTDFLRDIDLLQTTDLFDKEVKTNKDMKDRSKRIVEMVKTFYDRNGTHKPLIDRTQLLWYKNEVIEYANLHLTPQMEKFWKKGIERSGQNFEKVEDILTEIKKTNEDHLINSSAAQDCRVNVVDPRKLWLSTRKRNQGVLSTPDGVIWMNSLVVQNFTKDQIAFILGHEIAHILLEHAAEDFSIGIASEMIMHHAGVALFAGVPQQTESQEYEFNETANQMMKDIREVFPEDTKHELEADEVGTNLMAKSFNPDGAIKTFNDWSKGKGKEYFGGHYSYGFEIPPDQSAMLIDYSILYGEDNTEFYHGVDEMVQLHSYRPYHPDDDKRERHAMDTYYHEATFTFYAEQLKKEDEEARKDAGYRVGDSYFYL